MAARKRKARRFAHYASVDYLKTPEDVAEYLVAALEEGGDDAAYMLAGAMEPALSARGGRSLRLISFPVNGHSRRTPIGACDKEGRSPAPSRVTQGFNDAAYAASEIISSIDSFSTTGFMSALEAPARAPDRKS
ncbi:MAG: hypothetical protein PVSMB1_19570 [Gemmatimonadaceae bacterium]